MSELYYKDLESVSKDSFGKISRSSSDITRYCTEKNPFIDYQDSFVIYDVNPDGHHLLSYAPLSSLVAFITYGDVYTELETNRLLSAGLLPDTKVQHIGGSFNEYASDSLLVRNNYSLSHIEVNEFLISVSSPEILAYASKPLFADQIISSHYEKLGFDNAKEYWQKVEKLAIDIQRTEKIGLPKMLGNRLKQELSLFEQRDISDFAMQSLPTRDILCRVGEGYENYENIVANHPSIFCVKEYLTSVKRAKTQLIDADQVLKATIKNYPEYSQLVLSFLKTGLPGLSEHIDSVLSSRIDKTYQAERD